MNRPSAISVRRARRGDLLDMAAVVGADDSRWGMERLKIELEREQPSVWVALIAGNVRAFLVERRVVDIAEVLHVVTDAEHRGQGAAKSLMGELLVRLRADGVVRLDLEVSEHNEAALALYRAFGFEEVGRRKGYYRDASDALLMSLMLPSA